MIKDSVNVVKKYVKCQQHAHFHVTPTKELLVIMSPWPFRKRGINLLGSFLVTLGQVKYLIIAIDYFTKWVEVESLSTITVAQAWRFV